MSELRHIHKLHDGKLWVISILTGTAAGVDAWEHSVRDYIAQANSPERYLVYDTTGILNLGFTKYLQQRASVLALDNREALGRVAIVMNVPQVVRYLFETFITISSRHTQPRLSVKLFSERPKAVAWVEEGLRQQHPNIP